MKKQVLNFKKSPKKKIVGRRWAKFGLRKSQPKVRLGEISSPRQTSMDETNDCAMKCERGALVRDSDPPSGHSVHSAACDTWRARARRLIRTHLGATVNKTADKSLDPSLMAKNRTCFRSWRGAYDAAGNFSPPRRGCHLHSLALTDRTGVGSGLIPFRDARPIVA